MADASARVASGDLDVTLPEAGGGEMATLARSFNRMILGLRSVEQPADLLSTRLPAPPRLEPEAETSPVNETSTCQVAVLAISAAPTESLVPGVDTVAERAQAVMEALGSAVQAHRGQLLQFDGVDALAVFGGPPRRQPMQVSALLAMHAAFSVIDNLRRLDVKLRSGGGVGIEPRVAVHGGPIDFGEIGGEYGLPTLAVGATLGAAKSLLGPAARVPTGSVLASDVVVNSLSAGRSQFAIGRKGRVAARELNQEFVVHEVQDRRMTLTKSRNSQA
jgi:class 3 adenylate cyclase